MRKSGAKSSLSNRALSAAPRRSDPFGNALHYHAFNPEIAVRRHRFAGVGAFGDLAAPHRHPLLPRRARQGRKDTRRIARRGFRASVVFVADDQDGDPDRARFGIEDCLAGAPAAASAGRRLRPEVSKNSSTALSSNEGELVRSITTSAPATASLTPSPVIVLTPVLGEAATTSWPP